MKRFLSKLHHHQTFAPPVNPFLYILTLKTNQKGTWFTLVSNTNWNTHWSVAVFCLFALHVSWGCVKIRALTVTLGNHKELWQKLRTTTTTEQKTQDSGSDWGFSKQRCKQRQWTRKGNCNYFKCTNNMTSQVTFQNTCSKGPYFAFWGLTVLLYLHFCACTGKWFATAKIPTFKPEGVSLCRRQLFNKSGSQFKHCIRKPASWIQVKQASSKT